MKKIFSTLLDFIFPRYCCICYQYLSLSRYRYLCDKCSRKIIFPSSNLCYKCGYDFGAGESKEGKLCMRCSLQKFYFKSLRSAVLLNYVTRELIRQFKYKSGEHLVSDIFKIIQQNNNFMNFIADSVIVPVPLYWRRQFFREYNQSEVLAHRLTKLPIHVQVLPLLKRIRHTRTQVGLRIAERRNNMRNAFAINPEVKIALDTKLIVFDDIFTTGSTLNECCNTLKKYGFTNIYGASFSQVCPN
ncbi:MAG: double zinc ribbon domain-containing protein [Puniceicoccales bacterium]|jgi:ComF family protein|nr:double zinc ribbon domain-containing protein [Puniceicoccales bacterium]